MAADIPPRRRRAPSDSLAALGRRLTTVRPLVVTDFGAGRRCERGGRRAVGVRLSVLGGCADDDVMRIELAVVADCPHEEAATALLRQALDEIGLGSESFSIRVVESQAVA